MRCINCTDFSGELSDLSDFSADYDVCFDTNSADVVTDFDTGCIDCIDCVDFASFAGFADFADFDADSDADFAGELVELDGQLILASASPRRRELLAKIVGYNGFCVIPSNFDEGTAGGCDPIEYAKNCAFGKAKEVYGRTADLGKNRIVLSADTVVVVGEKILGKPQDAAEARTMLKLISNNTHKVITAVCIIGQSKRLPSSKTSPIEKLATIELATIERQVTTFVSLDKLSDSEIMDYIATRSPMDKAGAYGLQDKQIQEKLKEIRGSFDNVVGLPTGVVARLLNGEK